MLNTLHDPSPYYPSFLPDVLCEPTDLNLEERDPIENDASKLNEFFHSEVNLLIQHITVQDQDGQNNNIL